MGKNIYVLTEETTVPDGGIVYFGKPGGANPDPFEDRRATKTNFLKEVNALVTTNKANIATNASNISDLQDINTKRLDLSKVSTFTFTQPADSVLTDIYFKGAGTVSVSSISPVDDNIAASRLIEGGIRHIQISASLGYSGAAPRTIYVTLSGASVDVATFYKSNLFT